MPTSKRNSGLSTSLPRDGHDQSPVVRGSGAQSSGQAEESAIFSLDMEGNFIACSRAFTMLVRYETLEVIGRKFTSLFTPHEKEGEPGHQSPKAFLASGLADGYCRSQFCLKSKSSEELIFDLSATLLRNGSSSPAGFFVVVTRRESNSESHRSLPEAEAVGSPDSSSPLSREVDGTQFILASPIMHKFMSLVDRVASHAESVLITGETGTGKELIARTVHQSSHRRGRPWIDINCAALPENLVESELFGYEKGAFSGADSSKPGLFEMADKGTLFLDEIGELQLHTQVKLLRVLDGQPFYRLGGHRKIKVDVRIVAATNQDLEAAVKEGRFRQDLFHRLGQFQLRVPPLRERPEDIVSLAEHFLRLKASSKSFSPEAVTLLLSHPWPGNIRELRNLIAKVAMDTPGAEVDASRIRAALSGVPSVLRQTASMPVGNLDSMEEQMIIKALERTGGQRTQAAEQLGISRRTLSRKLKEYNITFVPGENASSLGFISLEQQKFFRARVQLTVTLKNARGEEAQVQGVNLSTGGMGLDGLADPLRFSGLLDISFVLPDSETLFQAKARLMWLGDEGRVGVRFAVIEPVLFEQLQHWTNKKMKEEGWEFPA
jgi:transcriptional regulator with PAS, ATPase and Fis domain